MQWLLVAEILDKVRTEGTNGYNKFDGFVYSLLETHLKNKGKRFTSDAQRTGLHAYAPDGINDIAGPTHIEVRFNLDKHTSRRLRDHIIHVSSRNRKVNEPFKNLLLISPTPLDREQKDEFSQLSQDEEIPFKIHVWDASELESIIDQNPTKVQEILNQIDVDEVVNGAPLKEEKPTSTKETKATKEAPKTTTTVISKPSIKEVRTEEVKAQDIKEPVMSEEKVETAPKPASKPETKETPMASTRSGDWKDVRSGRIETLSNIYKKEAFSLILGEGVSNSAGIPKRDTLINSLFVEYLTNSSLQNEDIQQIATVLSGENSSTSASASYLKKLVDKSAADAKAFAGKMSDLIYKQRDSKKPMASEIVKSIVELCIPKRRGAIVRSVSTYNYDDLLERQLQALSVEYKSVYADNSDVNEDEELPIFHVNGYLPEGNNTGAKNELVFSEEGENTIANNPYHWANNAQLGQLKNTHCLIIGMDMSNANLKRLLDVDKAARTSGSPHHFAFVKRWAGERFGQSNSAIDKFLSHHHGLTESLMSDLGVSVIWYEQEEEVANLLRAVRS